jgi:hypothetical protein
MPCTCHKVCKDLLQHNAVPRQVSITTGQTIARVKLHALLLLLLLLQFDWEVVVLDDPTVNAFVLPGGKIVVFTGEGETSASEGSATCTTIVYAGCSNKTGAHRIGWRLLRC